MVIIAICVVFVILDIELVKAFGFKGILKIRGVFRLLRIFILVRKLNAVRIRRELSIRRFK